MTIDLFLLQTAFVHW